MTYTLMEKHIGYEVSKQDNIWDAIRDAKSFERGFTLVDENGIEINWRAYDKAVDRCFDRCNLIGEDVDIWAEMNRYKVLREASEELREEAYEDIACRMGFMR